MPDSRIVQLSTNDLLAFTVAVLKKHMPRWTCRCSVALCSCGSELDMCPYRELAQRYLHLVEAEQAELPLGERVERYEQAGWRSFFAGLLEGVSVSVDVPGELVDLMAGNQLREQLRGEPVPSAPPEQPGSATGNAEPGEQTGSAADQANEGPTSAALPPGEVGRGGS